MPSNKYLRVTAAVTGALALAGRPHRVRRLLLRRLQGRRRREDRHRLQRRRPQEREGRRLVRQGLRRVHEEDRHRGQVRGGRLGRDGAARRPREDQHAGRPADHPAPFIQQADGKGLLQAYTPQGADKVNGADKAADGKWTSVVNNYFGFVYNKKELAEAPKTWEELLDPKYKGKLQYSTPGVAGDGTAVLIKAMHDFGGKEPGCEYLKKLQANNVGPSSSTSKLAPKTDKGELLVANGDVQMNFAQSKSMPNLGIWFPAKDGGKPTTFALPYAAGLVDKAPHTENGKKLLDYMLSEDAQKLVSSVGGGFPARTDVKPTDANAVELTKILTGVEIFEPDWTDIDKNLTGYVDAWKSATGS